MGHVADRQWAAWQSLCRTHWADSWNIKQRFAPGRLRRVALMAAVSLLAAGCGFPAGKLTGVHANLVVAKPSRVPASAPVRVDFDHQVDPLSAQFMIRPDVPASILWSGRSVQLRPLRIWEPAKTYTITIRNLHELNGSAGLDSWQGRFTAQPPLKASFETSSGSASTATLPFAGGTDVSPGARIVARFPAPMQVASVVLTLNGQPVAAPTLSWDSTSTTATLDAARLPLAQPFTLALNSGRSQAGDELTDPAEVSFRVLPMEPSNGSSGIGPGFRTVPPLQVVIENSGPARPQSGLQAADMVYEYISEYSVSRMTAMYFNNPPRVIGPVRSCRLINPPLNFAFHAFTMCSGASVGTLHFMFDLKVPAAINDFDRHGYFYRVGFKAAPHNLYTAAGRAPGAARRSGMQPTPPYLIDPPHPDNGLGQPAGAPSVPLHAVSYRYDPGTQQYYRYDHGAVFRDALTGAQLHVKNVILIHTPYKVMSYVEDDNGGAHSVRYFVYNQDESGPAEIYSDGKVINATWHMSWTSPMYFTDQDGRFIELNTGLTWIHVLGNGQRS